MIFVLSIFFIVVSAAGLFLDEPGWRLFYLVLIGLNAFSAWASRPRGGRS